MAYGDVGGPVTELVISCKTPDRGAVDIRKGDAVKLIGPYTVTNKMAEGNLIFGQALADIDENGIAILIKVRGICVFTYTGDEVPWVNGAKGILASNIAGMVENPSFGRGDGVGINLKVDAAAKEVHVLL